VILVISHPADVHARRVLERLASWGREAVLFDIADLPDESTLTIDYVEPSRPRVRLAHGSAGQVELTSATAVWWRRPQFVRLDAITDADALAFTHGEWHEALHGIYHLLLCPWMNPPQLDEAASRKAFQLAVASSLGMRVPDTIMTSDRDEAMRFIERHGIGRTIYKIFSATHQVWRETRLVGEDDLASLDSLRLAPVIFQEYIPAVADLRVTIVGDSMFPMAIDNRDSGYEVDFRVNLAEARTSAVELPDRVSDALRALMTQFGIVYGAVDLRLTPDGDYVFLEINPAGEFLFAEHGSGFPITDAVAGWLAAPT
jgi:glutathione synthase/RimK-type ligase-like ATP-grasp enzyme